MYPEIPYLVTYNNIAPWGTGYQDGVPFVSVDTEQVFAAGQVGFIRTVTLNGTIPTGGAAVITGIRNAFTGNFKAFSAPNVTMPNAMVQEISFGPQNYIGKVDYSIVLKDFSGFLYNVNNPVDEVSFQQETDGSVTINHNVSAVGIASNLDAATAFNNAKTFVIARTGVNGTISVLGTSFIPTTNKENVILLSVQEKINRVLGTYGVVETYKYDPLRNVTNETFKRFSLELNSGIGDDYAQVVVNGNYMGGKDRWNTGLFAQVASSELYTLANSIYPGLNPTPLSFSVESDEVTHSLYARNLSVRASYDNQPQAAFFEYDCDASKDFRLGITQVNVKGIVVGSGRHVRKRFESALNFYNSNIGGWDGARNYLYNAAITGTQDFEYTTYPYNPMPKSVSVIFNSGQGSINLSASFDDAPFVSGYSEFIWSVNSDCGLNIFKPHASANKNGSYLIQDLGILNRTSVTINGNFTLPITEAVSSSTLAFSTRVLPSIKTLEGQQNAFVEAQGYNISSGEAIKTGFNYQYTKDGVALSALPTDGRIYKGISI